MHDTVRKAFDQEKLRKGYSSPEDVRGLEDYVQMAKRNGTSIQAAMRDYVQMEDTLRARDWGQAHPHEARLQPPSDCTASL